MARSLPLISTLRPGCAPSHGNELVVHVLESGSLAFKAQVKILVTLARLIGHDKYRFAAWFTEELGPLTRGLNIVGVNSRLVRFAGARDPAGALRFVRALRADRPIIVHLHVGGRSLPWIVHRHSKAKVIAHLHATHDDHCRILPNDAAARRADAVIANSHSVASGVHVPLTVIYPGIASRPASARARRPAEPIIGAVGRLAPVKGHEHLVRAVRQLLDRGIHARLEILGLGAGERRLRDLAQELGLEHIVDFLGWCDDVTTVHTRWDIFATPSIQEGFGVATLEAMGSGLPVVASAVGGLRELVGNGRTGFLVPAGDAGALADRLGRLLSDETLRSEMGAAAREYAERCFSEDQMVARITEIYDRLSGCEHGCAEPTKF